MNRTKDSEHNIANSILKIRHDNKLSQEEFSEMIGVTRQAVSRWEMGISVPNINTLLLISEKFGVSVDSMLKETNDISCNSEPIAPVENKEKGNYGFVFLIIGILGIVSLPFLAQWYQIRSMEAFHTAYTNSYNYIFEYPLSIVLMLALLLSGLGIYYILKEKGGHLNHERKKD